MSRRGRNIIFAFCLLALIVFIRLDHSRLTPARQNQPQTETKVNARDFERYHEKTFTVVRVVDGDTLDIDVPDGNNLHTRIRLWGIDTPETKNTKTGIMYFGKEAAEFASESALGKDVMIYLEEHRTRDNKKYNRLLAYVRLPDGSILNEVLLTGGFAYADLRFRHSFYNKYSQLEALARSQKKGLWLHVTRDQLPQWLQRKKPNLLNK
jgi:endonuclease YncB( thermonuclease family)